ncbi:MAG TPA: class I SAM-dependent methyltransferase [Stellaceae bacterium]|nr:class I SAM-dependent methyltransferase [Stellaceae bacterium]
MWSETIGYRAYLKPYLKRFFSFVAESIPLTGKEDLLDLGCGTGEVALGFAPFVASLTGMDLERPMLEEAAKRAQAMDRRIRLLHAKVEDAPEDLGPFHLITMGRAHWFMHTPAAIARLDRWLSPSGRILVCVPLQNPDDAEWHRVYSATRRRWVKGIDRELLKLTVDQFFEGTDFVPVERVVAFGERKLELEHLIYRALGTPSTTPAILGADTGRMIAEMRAAMEPYFRAGPIMEKHVTYGLICRRRQDS